jgi:hypothetical protein
LAVKDPQPPLHAEMPAALAKEATPVARPARLSTPEDQGPGRYEPRAGRGGPARDPLSAPQCAAGLGVLTAGMVTRVGG